MSLQQHSNSSLYSHTQTTRSDIEEGKAPGHKPSHENELEREALPLSIRFFIKWSVIARPVNAVAFLLIWAVWNLFMTFALFATITDSVVAGATIGALGFVSGAVHFAQINFAKVEADPRVQKVKMTLLVENAQLLVSAVKKSAIGSILWCNCILVPASYFSLIFPKMGAGGSMNYVLNEHASLLTWLGLILSEVSMVLVIPFLALQDPMALIIQQTWIRKLKAYVKRVHSILIDLGSSTSAEAETLAMAEISAEQRDIDSWATAINGFNSTGQGLQMAMNLLWAFVPLGVLALNPAASSAGEIGTMCFLSLMCVFFFALMLSAATKPSISWNREVTQLLFDARIQNINVKLIQNRFKPWLDSHEINATRAFGVKVTLTRLAQFVSIVTSVFTLMTYFILREELQSVFNGSTE